MKKKIGFIVGVGLLLTCIATLGEAGRGLYGRKNSLFDDVFFRDLEQAMEERGSFGETASIDKDKITLSYDVPGLSSKDVTVSVEGNNLLVIKGEKKEKKETKKKEEESFYRASRSFSRALTLPQDAEITKITAEVKDGVLEVIIPRKPQELKAIHKVTVK